jgi:hypothetical protein
MGILPVWELFSFERPRRQGCLFAFRRRSLKIGYYGRKLRKKEHMVNALALGADEGRDELRKASGSGK